MVNLDSITFLVSLPFSFLLLKRNNQQLFLNKFVHFDQILHYPFPSSPISTRFFIVLLPSRNAILPSFSHHPLIILSWTFPMDYPSIARIREFSSRLIEPWDIFFLYSRPTWRYNTFNFSLSFTRKSLLISFPRPLLPLLDFSSSQKFINFLQLSGITSAFLLSLSRS